QRFTTLLTTTPTKQSRSDTQSLQKVFFFFKQKTAYEITTGDWSSDVCSSDLCRCTCCGRRPGSGCACPRGRRSEERRVGEERRVMCGARRSPWQEKKHGNT